MTVLNLVISGIPSIRGVAQEVVQGLDRVLNLVISGIPSIRWNYCKLFWRCN